MNVFSKPIQDKTQMISYIEYYTKQIDLTKCKIPELKIIARYNGLHVSGTKKVLVDRVETHFRQSKYAVKIQSQYRRYLVSRLFAMHGPGFSDRKKCVNDNDFYTLDPLNEIDIYNFFSYKDASGFIYGFNIQSLISMFQKSGSARNPYTRELFNDEILQKILAFNRISRIIILGHPKHEQLPSPPVIINRFVAPSSGEGTIQQPNYTNLRNQTLEKLEELRSKDVATRINEVFMEIDLLGNYTQSTWFSNLNMYSYIKFIQGLYNIWTQRANMSLHVRSQICPFYNPFSYQIDTANIFASYNMNLNNLRNSALMVMENIVFSGGEVEFRKIGVMHLLTALTLVSIPARESLPWLYESVMP